MTEAYLVISPLMTMSFDQIVLTLTFITLIIHAVPEIMKSQFVSSLFIIFGNSYR